MRTTASQRRLMVTVDVEAQPERAERDYVDRLIWGRFPSAPSGGIDAMMSIADRHGVKLVMFFDYPEREHYGESITDAAREIHRRGHDLELHAHTRFFPEAFWEAAGVKPFTLTDRPSAEQARVLLDYLCERHAEVTGTAPLGFRGGGYRYNAAILEAMAERAVRMDSSYNAGRPKNQWLHLGPLRQFVWDVGCIEVPISCVTGVVPSEPERLVEFNFNLSRFCRPQGVDHMLGYLDTFYEAFGDDAIAVLVMHSWSLSEQREDGVYSPPLTENIERFDEFLGALAGQVSIVTVPDVVALETAGSLGAGPAVAVEDLAAAALRAQTPAQPPSASGAD